MSLQMENRIKRTQLRIKQLGHTGRTELQKISFLYTKFFKNLKAPERLDLDDWMDKYAYLPSESASEHGRYKCERVPFVRKIAKKLSPSSPAKQIGVCKGAQLTITTLGVNWHLYIADQCPAPSMFVQPTADGAKDWVEQKLDPTVACTPKVRETMGDDRPKHLGNTKTRKYFPGGSLSTASSNSPMSMRSKSIKYLDVDEEDGCNQNVGKEGSSVYLAIRRTSNFGDSKVFRNSTPLMKDTSSIEPFCLSGTAERYLLPCPHCNPKCDKDGTYFELRWDHIKKDPENPNIVQCACPGCGELIDEHYKTWMMKEGNAFWYRYNPTPRDEFYKDKKRAALIVDLEKHGYMHLTPDDRTYLERTSIDDYFELTPTFFISSLYSPLGFFSWADAMADFLAAVRAKDKGLLKAFYNTVLGVVWSDSVQIIDYKDLKTRPETYDPHGVFQVPWEGLVLTMGVDVQGDRLEAQVIATGYGDEEFVIDYRVFYGDTAIIGDSDMKYKDVLTCWGELYEYCHTKFKHESGHEINIDCTMVDARYRSPQVFAFCKTLKHRNVFAVRGHEGWGNGFIERPTKPNRYGVMVFKAWTDELKVKIYSNLAQPPGGPNSIHFARGVDYPTLYFKGLVCEELKTKHVGGIDVQYWENPPGARNEALDTYVYSKAAFLAIRPSLHVVEERLSQAVFEPKIKKKKRIRSKGLQTNY